MPRGSGWGMVKLGIKHLIHPSWKLLMTLRMAYMI
ncbi:hypothetical protein P609_05830 [Comamonas thiooxydans]|nr:hypothetical protein P609_05830 [Comamonas thiooxydans]